MDWMLLLFPAAFLAAFLALTSLRGAEMDEIRYVDAAGNPVELDPTDPQARPLVIGQHITLS